jgi:hypothetical protein
MGETPCPLGGTAPCGLAGTGGTPAFLPDQFTYREDHRVER